MAKTILPFYKEFFLTIENYEIIKWEAKQFISKVLDENIISSQKKQNVYKGIDLLVRYGYFTKEVNPKNRRTFLYTETMKSQNLRKIKNNVKIVNILNMKLSDILQKIENKSSELDFMEKLIIEHPFIEGLLKNICISENDKLKELIVHKKLLFRLIDNFELLKKEVS